MFIDRIISVMKWLTYLKRFIYSLDYQSVKAFTHGTETNIIRSNLYLGKKALYIKKITQNKNFTTGRPLYIINLTRGHISEDVCNGPLNNKNQKKGEIGP